MMIRPLLSRVHRLTRLCALLAVVLGLLAAVPAQAATLQQVSNWGATGVPTDVSMYVYLPTAVGANAPILVLLHYCGGGASGVFTQAQGGGIVTAADQYGFIIIVPSAGTRCWDTVSNKGLTRDGGGDSTAIRQMVTYAIATYQGNPDRVYATGVSSGAAMTELLLALYPDLFKAGAAFAGLPAGCRTGNETGNGYSSACASGSVTHTAQEWGDIVRNMGPAYTAYRPRVQLFQGDHDGVFNYLNFDESLKEWTNVLGLGTTPTSTQTGVTLGTHQATRQTWQDLCGYVALDAFTSIGGDHGPSDALFVSQYIIPFLGLDKTGPVDPGVQQCAPVGTGGASGTGGIAGSGGTTGTGGQVGTGGLVGSGGGVGTGGMVGSGGIVDTGGLASSGGTTGLGGVSGAGGVFSPDAAIGKDAAVSTGGAIADAPGVSVTGGATGTGDAGLVVDANAATGGIGGGSGGAGGSTAQADGASLRDLDAFDVPTYASTPDADIGDGADKPDAGRGEYDSRSVSSPNLDAPIASIDTGGSSSPEPSPRHGLYGLPSCSFCLGTPAPNGVLVLLAMLLLRRRSARHGR
jgi:acetylxylan esterase